MRIRARFAYCLIFVITGSCTFKENKSSGYSDSTLVKVEPNTFKEVSDSRPVANPLDTIIISYPNGKKLHFIVLEYYDSLLNKPIKDFEVRDVDTGESVFRSVSKRLALGYEVDPINGYFDSLFVIPTYSISSKDPLTVDLDFIVNGQFRVVSLSELTYAFYEGRPLDTLFFLRYKFQSVNNNTAVQSSLQFKPNGCNVTEMELMAQFNKIKVEHHLDTEIGGELMKLSFICFLNGRNPDYEMITKDFKQAFGESSFPYNYYVFIIYLDRFIINLTSE